MLRPCPAAAAGKVFELDGWKFVEPYATSGTLHLIGLLSDGGVHSRYALCLTLPAAAAAVACWNDCLPPPGPCLQMPLRANKLAHALPLLPPLHEVFPSQLRVHYAGMTS